jgi:hypothetical protein
MDLQQFAALYQAFRGARDVCFKIAGDAGMGKNPGEIDSRYNLRLATWYEPHRRTADAADKAFEEVRARGVELLDAVFADWPAFQAAHQTDLNKYLFSQLANVWLFVLPLESINWKKMKEPAFSDTPVDNWRNVLLLSFNASLERYPFYAAYCNTADKDPFPNSAMDEVDRDVATCTTPASLQATAETAAKNAALHFSRGA